VDRSHIGHNRAAWNADADRYQRDNRAQIGPQIHTGDPAWGVWGIPESKLNLLGDVTGKRVLELGCGGAQWSLALARRGAHPIGLDLSDRQLVHARASMAEAGIDVPLVQATGEDPPFAGRSFDIVFADYGAFTFGDPYRTIPNAARMLRPGGLLVFTIISPIMLLSWPMEAEHPTDALTTDYFGMHRFDTPNEATEFNLTFGGWIELFTRNGLIVEDLIEPRPDPDTISTYRDETDRAWSRRWPSECIWRLRKQSS
jgi:SAM-dependent methyltransferase